ncbi:hypothetical protein Scep_022572 [Stephania cephalantha]|uniref:Uncharacterized protein n=1 Tax=Stephania cephalantha TaxID=152367 RepID=A0AAP0FG34_9MAGN
MSFVGEGNIVIPKKRSSTNKGLKSKSNAREVHHQQIQEEIMGGGKVVVVKEEKTSLPTTTSTSSSTTTNNTTTNTRDVLGDVMMGWEEWPCWWNVMEEQMIWGCVMVPGWEEMDFKGGLCGHNEVVWEDDIWCLRDIKHTPY